MEELSYYFDILSTIFGDGACVFHQHKELTYCVTIVVELIDSLTKNHTEEIKSTGNI